MQALTRFDAFGHEETNQEKYDRLERHLKALQAYQLRLEDLFLVNISITATRSASNVEVYIESDDVSKFRLEDDYALRHVPHLSAPQSWLGGMAGAMPLRFNRPNFNAQINESAYKDKAYSNIKHINAGRSKRLFADDLYVFSTQPIITLRWRTFATELQKEQTGSITINPDDAETISLATGTEPTDDNDDDF